MKIKSYYLLVCLILITSTCKKEERRSLDKNYCDNAYPTIADFIIEEKILGPDPIDFQNPFQYRYFETDSIFVGRDIYFTSKQSFGEYLWKVGNDPRVWKTKQMKIWFDKPTTVNVTLIVKQNPNIICFPKDKGIDTITKKLVVVGARTPIKEPNSYSSPANPFSPINILGDYIGYNISSPTETITVKVYQDSVLYQGIWTYYLYVSNLPAGCNNPPQEIKEYGNYSFSQLDSWWENCSSWQGWGILDKSRHELIIDYQYKEKVDSDNYIIEKFIGIKK